MTKSDTAGHITWSLWLDDQVYDPDMPRRHAPQGYHPADSFREAVELVERYGPPTHVSLDHDLGDGVPNGLDFLKWLYENHPDDPPARFNVHSANPNGKLNMISYYSSWVRSREM